MSDLLNRIIDDYINSWDFNGVQVSVFEEDCQQELIELLHNGKIEVLSDSLVMNPHIKAYDLESLGISKEKQHDEIINNYQRLVIYPTPEALKHVRKLPNKPFTSMLRLGEPKHKFLYFDIEILELYYRKPIYNIWSSDYRGGISVNGDIDEEDYEYVRDFGIGYNREDKSSEYERVVVMMLTDLDTMNDRTQQKWNIYLKKNQTDYYPNSDYIKNLVYGEWVTNTSIYDALLDEMILVNELCTNAEMPIFFRKNYRASGRYSEDIEYKEKPSEFRYMLLPTQENYDKFIVLLEKMVIHNINVKFFTTGSDHHEALERFDEDGNPKGTLTLLGEWCEQHGNPQYIDKIKADILKPMKTIRKIRQRPAHEIYENHLDKKLWIEQNNNIKSMYRAVKCLRRLISTHPANLEYKPSKYLNTGESVVVY